MGLVLHMLCACALHDGEGVSIILELEQEVIELKIFAVE